MVTQHRIRAALCRDRAGWIWYTGSITGRRQTAADADRTCIRNQSGGGDNDNLYTLDRATSNLAEIEQYMKENL